MTKKKGKGLKIIGAILKIGMKVLPGGNIVSNILSNNETPSGEWNSQALAKDWKIEIGKLVFYLIVFIGISQGWLDESVIDLIPE